MSELSPTINKTFLPVPESRASRNLSVRAAVPAEDAVGEAERQELPALAVLDIEFAGLFAARRYGEQQHAARELDTVSDQALA